MCGGYRQGNGKGYCANSRKSPLLCCGDSGQTCLLCGRVKGGERGCWARGCASGEAAETLTEAALRNRASNVRSSHRERARQHNGERLAKEAEDARELRSQRDLAAARGLRTCLRAEPGLREGERVSSPKRVSWSAPYPPSGRPLTEKPYGSAQLRQTLWWPGAGETAECDGCGRSCPLRNGPQDERGQFQVLAGRSKFALATVLCPKCRKDGGAKKKKHKRETQIL